jgi:hypothetical protein
MMEKSSSIFYPSNIKHPRVDVQMRNINKRMVGMNCVSRQCGGAPVSELGR